MKIIWFLVLLLSIVLAYEIDGKIDSKSLFSFIIVYYLKTKILQPFVIQTLSLN